jgi:uncharacterized membrane protein HdeD (DUF308 family)
MPGFLFSKSSRLLVLLTGLLGIGAALLAGLLAALLLLARLLIAATVLTTLVAALVLLAGLVRIVHKISYSVGMEALANVSQSWDVP